MAAGVGSPSPLSVPVQGVFEPMDRVSIGAIAQRAFSLYTSQLGWFIAWGLAVAVFSAALTAATAGWAILLGLCLIVPTHIGLYAVAEAAACGDEIDASTVLQGFRRGPAYLLGLLETLMLVVGFLALVLPAVILAAGLTWTTVALYRRELGPLQAIRRSLSLAWSNPGLTAAVCVLAWALNTLGSGTIVLGAVAVPLVACIKSVAFEQISPRPSPLL